MESHYRQKPIIAQVDCMPGPKRAAGSPGCRNRWEPWEPKLTREPKFWYPHYPTQIYSNSSEIFFWNRIKVLLSSLYPEVTC